jgi:hypothetical protein
MTGAAFGLTNASGLVDLYASSTGGARIFADGGAGTADVYSLWRSNSVLWSLGIDQSDSGAFKLNKSASPSSGTTYLSVSSGGDFNFQSGDLTTTGDVAAQSLSLSTGTMEVGHSTEIQNINAGGQIAATSTFVFVVGNGSAVTANGTTAIADGTDGQMLIIVGRNDANTVTINDGANTVMAGNVTLGSGDSITFVFGNGNWYELSRSNN